MKVNHIGAELQPDRGIAPTEPVRLVEKVALKEGEPGEEVQRELSRSTMEKYIEKLNQAVELAEKSLRFTLHEESERMQVLVVDTETQEVIKEIPPEKVLDVIGRIREMVGILLDERV